MNRIALLTIGLLLIAAPVGLADPGAEAESDDGCALVQVSPYTFPHVTVHPDCITGGAAPQP